MTGAGGGPPQRIFIIRHAEKPPGDTTPNLGPSLGIDITGNQSTHSLTPRGWQRSGALAVLFEPAVGPLRAGLARPDHLFSPAAHPKAKTIVHRTYQTILAISERTNTRIISPYPKDADALLADHVLTNTDRTVLICWEHQNIPALARAIPTTPDATIPTAWPDERFDVIWSFVLSTDNDPLQYKFSQIPQLLLNGDMDQPITAT